MKNNNLYYQICLRLIYLFDFNVKSFPFLIITTSSLLILESLTYPGFLLNHFILGIEHFLILTLISGLFVGLTLFSETKVKYALGELKVYEFVKNLFIVTLLPLSIFLYIFQNILGEYGDSIIISSKSLFFPSRFLIAFLVISFYLIIYYVFVAKFINPLNKEDLVKQSEMFRFKKMFSNMIYFGLVILLLIYSIRKDFVNLKFDLKHLLKKSFLSYEQKMQVQIGPHYYYYKFIVDNTPKDSIILKPKQQGQWPDLSNEGYSRYFLYPRHFISEENFDRNNELPDYVFLIGNKKIINDESLNIWPDFNVPAKEIILYSPETRSVLKVIKGDYNYKKFLTNESWGVIVVDKNKKW